MGRIQKLFTARGFPTRVKGVICEHNLLLLNYMIHTFNWKFDRMLRMIETGLVDFWKNIYLPKPYHCMIDLSSRRAMLDDIRNPALVDLYGLFPAFVFLLFGLLLALVALLGEWIKNLRL